jgi:hypothetical protein
MITQQEYLLVYGAGPTKEEIKVWAFSIEEAIKVGDKIRKDSVVGKPLTKVEVIYEKP